MSEKDEQRLEDEDAPEASEQHEEAADVEGHNLRINDPAQPGEADKAFH